MPGPDGIREFLLRRKPERVAVRHITDQFSVTYVDLVEVLDDAVVTVYDGVESIHPFTAIKYILLEK